MSEQDQYAHDVYLSFSQADEGWVRTLLLPRLEDAKLDVVLSTDVRGIGSTWTREVEQAITGSRYVIAILSASYLADEKAMFEANLAQTVGLERGSFPLIPILVEQVALPPRFALLKALDVSDSDTVEGGLHRLVRELARAPMPEPEPTPAPEPVITEPVSGRVSEPVSEMEPRGGCLDLIRRLFGGKTGVD